MIVESLIENPPPIIGGSEIPEYARPYCDTWGNLTIKPVKSIEESHGPNFVKVLIFMVNSNFYYSFQIKLNKVIFQKQANVNDKPEESENNARLAARNELLTIVTENKVKEMFLFFDKICYNQPELF
jgi:hypothetical protein